MITNELQNRFAAYIRQARDYAQSPSVMAGLTLDESSTRLRQVALTDLKDTALARCLEQLRLILTKQNGDQINTLLDEMESLLQAHHVS